jgi:hypothetical protein
MTTGLPDEPTTPPVETPSSSLGVPARPQTADAEAFATNPELASLAQEPDGEVYESPPKISRRGQRLRRTKSKPATPASPVAGMPQAPDRVVAVVPAMTSFDFLEGSYQKVRQTRLILTGIVGLIGAIALIISAIGLSASLEGSGDRSALPSVISSTTAATAKYDHLTGLGPTISGATLAAHVSDRTAALKSVLDYSTDIGTILSRVYALAVNGVKVTSINIVPTPPPVVDVTTTTTPGQTPTTTTTIAGAPTVVQASSSDNMTIVVTVPNYSVYTSLTDELQAIKPYLSNVSAVPAGAIPDISVTITAVVTNLPLATPSAFIQAGGKAQ